MTIYKIFFTTISIFFANFLFAMNFQTIINSKYNLIYGSGKIYHGDLYRLKKAYSLADPVKQTILVLSSNGGELQEGIKLGKFIYNNNIATAVKERSICVSSCALTYLGGRNLYGEALRILPSNTKIGFHSFYYKNKNFVDTNQFRKDLNSIIDYFSYVNAPNKLMTKMLKTKPSNMFWITNRYHKKYLKTTRLSIENIQNSNPNINKYSINNSSHFVISKQKAIKQYLNIINLAINSNNYLNNSEVAFNSNITYRNWLSKNLNYVSFRNIKILNNNRVKVYATYFLKNGQKVKSRNIYTLKKDQYGWKVFRKKIKPFKRYKRVARYLTTKLP